MKLKSGRVVGCLRLVVPVINTLFFLNFSNNDFCWARDPEVPLARYGHPDNDL